MARIGKKVIMQTCTVPNICSEERSSVGGVFTKERQIGFVKLQLRGFHFNICALLHSTHGIFTAPYIILYLCVFTCISYIEQLRILYTLKMKE